MTFRLAERYRGKSRKGVVRAWTTALEVKLAASIDDKAVRHLHWLSQQHGRQISDLAVLTTGPHAYRRSDGIAVIPLGLLGP